MPAAVPGAASRAASVKTQAHHAREAVVLKLFHLAEPWLVWVALAGLAALVRGFFPGMLPAAIVAAAGIALAVLDHHLRAYRSTVFGRCVGPVTILACCGWLAAVVLLGWSRPALEAWLFGGLAGCLGWDAWLAHGDHHDLSRAYVPAAETAFGVPGSKLTGVRKKKNVTSAVMAHPRGALSTGDAASRIEHLEGALGYPPGSWALTSDRADAGLAGVSITDPRLLDAAPFPFPGPSAPGESVSVPFRLGPWADGEPMLYDLLPLHHIHEMGCTGAGKSESWWNFLAEGITRHDFACLAADMTKGDQFLGPVRPALHWLATDPEDVLELHAAVHRVVRARCDFLAKNHMTEWKPGCGLKYLSIRREETPDIFGLLKEQRGPRLREHISDVRASRSAGVAWWDSYQRTDHTQMPTIVRGQMGYCCFGVMEAKDAEFGLSELQRERGCRPQLWGANIPGKAVWDTLTIPEVRKTVPMRHYWWGPDSSRIASFASEWPASRRPLDDVTGEALEAKPPRPASSGFPAPASTDRKPARKSAPEPAGQHEPASRRSGRISAEEAHRAVKAQLAAWRLEGTQFTVRMLLSALGEEVVCPRNCGNPACTGRSRGWLYERVKELAAAEVLAEAGGHPVRYEVVGDPEGANA